MNLDTLSTSNLFDEIAGLAREQGITSQVDWNGVCDEVLDSHEQLGELNDDQDLQLKREQLYAMWPQYELEAGEESVSAIGEDPEAPHL
jgi:hypothetical protein